MAPAQIFLTGASGYIGGAICNTLLKYPNKYEITTLVRNVAHVEPLNKLGVRTVMGSLDDVDLLSQCAQAADAVIHAASAEHFVSTQALVNGLKAKKDKGAVYIQTSSATGDMVNPNSSPVYNDLDIPTLRSIPNTLPYRQIEAFVFDNSDEITTAIIAPSAVTGLGSGPLKQLSIQVPNLVRAVVARKQSGWVGPNPNVVWPNVNIHDLAELYRLVLDGLLANEIGSGKDGGYYFGCNGTQLDWRKVAGALAEILYEKALVATTDVTQFEKEYVDKYLWGDEWAWIYDSNVRAEANRSRIIGWNPTHPHVYETLEQEVSFMIANNQI